MMRKIGRKINSVVPKIVPQATRLSLSSLCPWWEPLNFIKSVYIHLGEKNVREASSRLKRYQRYYSGERCFIMGNGPSIKEMDLDLFGNDFIWATNKCYLLFDRISWRPSFYIAVDKRVVPDISEEINRLIADLQKTKFFFPVQFRVKSGLRSGSNVYWYREIDSHPYNCPKEMFTTDASKWVSNVMTVTIAALQLAVYLGFDPIYLIGCDTSYSIPQSVKTENKNSEFLVSTKNDDPNHFDSRYFGMGSKWHVPHVEKMISHYEKAKIMCDKLGVKVYNATVGGKLEVFPRIEYRDLF